MLLINKTLLKMSKGIRGWIALIVICKMLVLVGTAEFAKALSGFLGSLIESDIDLKSAVISAFLAALLMLIGSLLVGEAEYRCAQTARLNLRRRIFSKILQLDVGNVDKIGVATAITAASDGVENMQLYYTGYLPGLFYALISPFYLFMRIKDASLPAAMLLFAVSFLILPANNVFRQVLNKLKKEYWESLRDLTGYYLESLQGITTFKLFKRDEYRTEMLRGKAGHYNRIIMGVMKMNFLSFLMTEGMLYGSVFAAVVIVGVQLYKGTATLSDALMVLMLSYGFYASIRELMGSTHQALGGIAAAQNISEILDIDASRPTREFLPEEGETFRGIKMEHVSFAYAGRGHVLKDVSIEIPEGSTVALIGRSGCGKSTAAGLLLRFYDCESGRITLNGRDYLSITPEELRKQVIMVPQSVSIFSGTIEDNLRMAAPDATEEQLMDALMRVRLSDWVCALPDGLKTDVGDAGGKLSGGQKQKIGIARALLSNAPTIIFDEATSSVDIDSENEIWECINELAQTHTLIIISHRLSTIRRADRIYLLVNGEVSASGDHDSLMTESELYRNMVEEQSKLEHQGEGGTDND